MCIALAPTVRIVHPMKKPLITSNKDVLTGTPVFAGTRVPIKNLTDYLEGGSSIDEFLEEAL